jgi:hypothetical protein
MYVIVPMAKDFSRYQPEEKQASILEKTVRDKALLREVRRAQEATRRAEALAKKLRELGIDPDQPL